MRWLAERLPNFISGVISPPGNGYQGNIRDRSQGLGMELRYPIMNIIIIWLCPFLVFNSMAS